MTVGPLGTLDQWGVLPTGFNRKDFNTILLEIQAAMRTEFGANVIQTPQSRFGQLNGLQAFLITTLWEFGEDVYQSYDIEQAEGVRLDMLAQLRLMQRGLAERDESFRLAISNQGRARIDTADITRAVAGIEGVTYVQVWVNDSQVLHPTKLPPASICVAVIGGDDSEIAAILRKYIVPGISTWGNLYVNTNIDGFCRAMAILRPILVPVRFEVQIKAHRDANGCPPPSAIAIRDALIAAFTDYRSPYHLLNSDDITYYRVRSLIEAEFPSVEVLSVVGQRIADPLGGNFSPIVIEFEELATVVAATDVTINDVGA